MDVNNLDFAGFINDNRVSRANAILGKARTLAGMDPAVIQQLSMLGANSTAYRRLLEAEKTGTVRQNVNYGELMSDRYRNDNYNPETGALVKPVYTPKASPTPTLDMAADAGNVLDSLRRLALAAVRDSDALNQTHYDMFSHLAQAISSNVVNASPAEAGGAEAGQTGGETEVAVPVVRLGETQYAGRNYSFSDLSPGGAASLAINPDAAREVINQAIRDIYDGKVGIRGFDPASSPMLMPA